MTFEQLAKDWLIWGEHERGWRHSTLVDRRSCVRRHLLPAFGHLRVQQVTTPRIERWKSDFLIRTGQRRQVAKLVALLHSMYERAAVLYGLQRNPVAGVTRIKVNYDAARFDFYSPEEVWALVRAANDKQDAAILLTAAFAGLRRGEIVALRWRDVDFAKRTLRVETSVVHGRVDSTKGGRGRAVPMVREVPRRWPASDSVGAWSIAKIPCSPARASGSTAQRCDGALWPRASGLSYACCASTTCATRSARTRSTEPTSCRSRRGWATRTTARRCATCHHKSFDAEADLLAGAFAVNNANEAKQLLLSATGDEET